MQKNFNMHAACESVLLPKLAAGRFRQKCTRHGAQLCGEDPGEMIQTDPLA
jgi:hypothetical protein